MTAPETGASVPKAWIVAGHYFRILAFASLLSSAFSLIQVGHLQIDFSFISLFWIATGVMTGRKGPRILAVVVCAATAVLYLAGTTYSFLSESSRMTLWSPRTAIHVAVLDCAKILILTLLPLTLLLRPGLMGTVNAEEAVHEARWTHPRYILAALLLGGVSTALSSAAGEIELQSSFTHFRCGDQAVTSVVTDALTVEKKPGLLFISSWVIGESNTSGTSTDSGRTITLGNRAVRPNIHPHGYLKLLETPAEPSDLANVLLIRTDGRIVPIQRRVTPATYGPAMTAILTARDFDDLQRKLEAALPSVPKVFPPDLY